MNFSLASTFLKRVLRSAGQSLMRNKLLSAATVLIIALMLFVFNLILALSFASDSIILNVGEKLDISVEMMNGAENYTIQTFVQTLKNHPQVKDVIYISREDALSKFGGKYPGITAFLKQNNLENPLPDVVRIVSQTVADNNEVIQFLEQPQFSNVVNQEKLMKNMEQKERNEKILSITQSIKRLSIWLIVIFTGVGLLIIFNSINIKVHSHENEIQIMKLVGATYSFIRAGFVSEGLTFAVSALAISLIFSRIFLAYLTQNLVAVISNETLMSGLNAILVHFKDRFWITVSWQLLMMIILGMISSYLAIELYLRKKQSF